MARTLPMRTTSDTPGGTFRLQWPSKWLGHALLIGVSFLALFPIYWMFVTSVKPENEIYGAGLWPQNFTFANYQYVWEQLPFARILGNTFLVASMQTLFQIITATLAAYAFARWRFPGRNVLMVALTLTWLVPFQTIMIPNYVLITQLKWLDTLQGLIVPNLASAFAVLLLFQAVKGFPVDLIDAARSDGATNFGLLWRIILPNIRSSLAALAVLLFISAWNEYFWPVLINRKIENSMVQIALQFFRTSEGDQWGPLMAASSMASIPVLIVYIVLQRQIIDSFVKSGLRS